MTNEGCPRHAGIAWLREVASRRMRAHVLAVPTCMLATMLARTWRLYAYAHVLVCFGRHVQVSLDVYHTSKP